MTRCLVLLLVLVAPASMPSTVAAQTPACTTLPANIVVPAVSHQWIEDLIATSPTLQRQCGLIAEAEHVVVRVASLRRVGAWCRARTSFTRDRVGRLRAAIDIPVSVDFAELLAHELEHVVEQIEGVNLRRLARVRDSGVREVGPNVFETTRATEAGLMAAGEVIACGAGQRGCGRVLMVAATD
jgi:hypothetical protein